MDDRELLADLYRSAVAAADPEAAMEKCLPKDRTSPVVVVGAGKASARMAAILESLWQGQASGVVVVPYGYGAPTESVQILEAGHPVPDRNGLAAVSEIQNAVQCLGSEDFVVALISGGGSALLPSPPPGFSLEDEVAMNEALLASGAPIAAMNAVRKQFSLVKGGRLAASASPARVLTLVVSDVPGDDPALVASGPTIADGSTAADAREAIRRYQIRLPERVDEFIRSGGLPQPTLRVQEQARNEVKVVASARLSLEAAARRAEDRGLNVRILSDSIEGESREVAKVLGAIAKEVLRWNRPWPKPAVLLSGGETTVTLRPASERGSGGPNTELQLAFALEVAGCEGLASLAADTDGIDGTGSNAGAFVSGSTIGLMRNAGVDPAAVLARNDAATGFGMIDGLFAPGPTGTNVNDFRAIIVR